MNNKRRFEDDLHAELGFHLEQQVRDFIASGMTEEEAVRRAKIEFGGMEQIKEECREARTFALLEDLFQDLAYALRTIVRNPGFSLVAVLTLAVGIGANSAVFSVVNAVLLRPLNAPEPDRMVRFLSTYSSAIQGVSEFTLLKQQTTQFEDISAHWVEMRNLMGNGEPRQAVVALVSGDFFHLFGTPVSRGRLFIPEEDRPGGGNVAIVSYEFWSGYFGGDPELVGKTISLNNQLHVVVGILGRGSDPEQFDQRPDVWIPFQIDPRAPKNGANLCVITGRLKPGATFQSANADLERVATEYHQTSGNPGINSFGVQPLRDALVGNVRPALMVLLGSVAVVLLIACTNAANLLLVRASSRRREISIRAAIGAGRGRIVRQLLAESALMSLAAGVLGLLLSSAGVHFLLSIYPHQMTPITETTISIPRIGLGGSSVVLDWRVLVFTLALSLCTGLGFGLIPALYGSRTDLNTGFQESGSLTRLSARATRSLLVVSQITLAVILLIGSALLIRSFIVLHNVNPGFDGQSVLTMRMSLSGSPFETRSGIGDLTRRAMQQIQSLPGVVATSATCCLPLDTVWQNPFIVEGRPLTGRWHGFAGWTFVSPGYFDVFKIPVLRGRTFTGRDSGEAPGVVVINEAMARLMWQNGDPLRDHLLVGRGMSPAYEDDPPRQIIGIVGNVRDVALNRNPRPVMYVPIAQMPDRVNATVLRALPIAWTIRIRSDALALRSMIKEELRSVSGGLPVGQVRLMSEVTADSIARQRFNMTLMGLFGAVALLLAASGIYAVIAYSVQQRTKELGIRLALGANPKNLRRMVIFQGMRMTIGGIIAGLAAAFGMTHLLTSFLFGVQPHDLPVFIGIPILLTTVALLAALIPAWRASRIDPMTALRYE